ncbi:hypothetical protein [Bacillus suaedaesalsae]|uniref:Uncharacterized protein n=1 Tax=Bacillus suaedaesalsae TaxID=2810349 RepID=A0ABS2DL18_9BACI|nr:hypothetical protein [Bacillus suaedaesalsae]MBM6619194.1 hypothetical protein [Bacillus suaedaesalsae]
MGTKFNNILIKTDDFEEYKQQIKSELKKYELKANPLGYIFNKYYYKTYNDYTVLLGSSYSIDMFQVSRLINKAITGCVTLAFNYFDDDLLEIQMIMQGNEVAFLSYGDEYYFSNDEKGSIRYIENEFGITIPLEVMNSEDLEEIITEFEKQLNLSRWISGEWKEELGEYTKL